MLVGAMLDCGLDFELLRSELRKLGVEGYELNLRRVDRSGISASKFDVRLTGETHSRNHEHEHDHEHAHEHNHDHEHHEHHEHNPQSAIRNPITGRYPTSNGSFHHRI